jgi:hypothetical protein
MTVTPMFSHIMVVFYMGTVGQGLTKKEASD